MPATLKAEREDPTPESIREARSREQEAARMAWMQPRERQKRAEMGLVMVTRWLRFHRPSRSDRNYLESTEADLKRLVAEMTAVMEHPGDLVTGATWAAAAERRERYDAELTAVQRLLKDHLPILR